MPKLNWKAIKLLVLDFDGVMTDNKVYLDENGKETVACSRGDGYGVEIARKKGIEVLVISKERNKVVKSRCDKLKISCIQSIDYKLQVLQNEMTKRDLKREQVCYVGNDMNDAECMDFAGIGVAVSDSFDGVLEYADYVTEAPGGNGAVREVCDKIIEGN
jgi:YrbI family 3-deoxy-D-manno-octulosonate 8-phosphate phosphatase